MPAPSPQPRRRVLTGITTTGIPHLGNYVGAIRPAIAASQDPHTDSFYFLADYHALVKCDEPARVAQSCQALAATWLACGLDPERVTFYRQSDIPEITELTWLLTCVTGKGLMNRAHAYKAALDANQATGVDPDDGVTMGLFCYPVLMAADILMFSAHIVPVGKDQVQHIEMARDIAQRFNNQYAAAHPLLTLPQAQVEAQLELLPGLDGRKMSKSYDNVVALFEGGAAALRESVARIVTDSKRPGEPKTPEGTPLLALYQAFATPEQTAAFAQSLRDGLAWGEAKTLLVATIESELAPMRAQYESLMSRPAHLQEVLASGASKARAIAAPLLAQMREAVGLRRMTAPGRQTDKAAASPSASPLATFKQYREASSGQFGFKLIAAGSAQVLLQGTLREQAREVGALIAALKATPDEALSLALAERCAFLGEGVSELSVRHALHAIQQAESASRKRI